LNPKSNRSDDKDDRRGWIWSIGSFRSSATFYRNLFSAFIGDISVPIFAIFLPLLANSLGASPLEVGIVGGANYSIFMFMPFILGRLANKRSTRRFFVVGSFSILTAASLLYVVISNPIALIATRLFEGVAWSMLWPSIEVALTLDSGKDPRSSLGTYNFVWSFAAAMGPIVGSVLVFFGTIRLAFVITSIMMIAALVANLIPLLFSRNDSDEPTNYVIRPQPVKVTAGPENEKTEVRVYNPPSRLFYLATTATGAASATILFTFFPSYFQTISSSILLVGVVTFGYGLARFLGYAFAGRESVRQRISDLANRKKVLFLTLGVSCFSSLLLFVPDRTGTVEFISFALVGVGYAIVMSICQIGMIAEAPPERRGTGAGMLESSIGTGAFLGPVIAGAISAHSLSNAFLVPSVGFIILIAESSIASTIRMKTKS